MADRGESIEDIGWRIRQLRLALGQTNASAFATSLGWSAQQLNNYERGRKRIEISQASKLCNRYNVTLDWIYRGERAGLPVDRAHLIQDHLESLAG